MQKWEALLSLHCGCFSITEIYEQVAPIGEGKFARVFEAQNRITGEISAVKKIDKKKLDQKEKQFLMNELLIISMISHPNVVEVRQFFETKKWIYITMECVRGGELYNFLEENNLTEREIAYIMKQLLEGV